ncbi:MAG: hypothetical protein GXO91_09935 [FCB group bacterium]|nr:hypothetical protein [FCB group bacterium]
MADRTVYVNGKWILQSAASVPFNDAGFVYGDGLFETIRFQNRLLFRPEKHLERLRAGLRVLQLHPRQSDDMLHKLLKACVQKNDLESGLLRLMITRGLVEGPPWQFEGEPGIYLNLRPLSPPPPTPVKVVFLREKDYPIIRFNPAIKSMNYVGNLLAKKEAERRQAYEPVFVNRREIITECAIRNIFFIKDRVLMTPSLELGVLPGVMRDTVIELARELSLTVLETFVPYGEVDSMTEAFITSTGIGLLPCTWEGWSSDYEVTFELQKLLQRAIGESIP